MFFDGKLEWDVSLGYRDVKKYGNSVDFISSWRANLKITDDLSFVQRAYIFVDHESMDNQFRTSLIYRIRNHLSFEIRHNFEQRRYEQDNLNRTTNLANRSLTLGLVFDLN
jgi:putative salt-induced outer membrane protein YdiY